MKNLFVILLVSMVVSILGVGCGDSGGSWIEGKWNTEIMGRKIEMDFRSNGEYWLREIGGEFMGKEIAEEENPTKKGTWSFDGNVLAITETGQEVDEAVVTRTEDGFVMQPAGTPLALSFRRP